MSKKNVLYTVITCDYDFILPPVIKQPAGWDLICFTDDPDAMSSVWQIKPLPALAEFAALQDDPVRQARLAKILPHRFLADYDRSVYIDGNRILDKNLDDFAAAYPQPLVCMDGAAADPYGAVDELLNGTRRPAETEVIEIPPLPDSEKKLLKKQAERWKSKGLPANGGCPATFLISRLHNDKKVVSVMEAWAKEVLTGSIVDEPALPFACFVNHVKWTSAYAAFPATGYLLSAAELVAVRAPHKKHLLGDNPPAIQAYPPNPPPPGGPYDGYPTLLTVGVPVSNQIGTILRCLEHIKPLLDAVPSELLVVDTGSTDGTVEVCREFGARVVEFPWINDMSAARNTGIRNARSAWYMSIDDDEWFEDVTPIIQFFKEDTYKHVNAAIYYQRNFGDMNEEAYRDFPALRIFKIQPNSHFEGRIHDALMLQEQFFIIKAYARHTGFAARTQYDRVRKAIRNASSLRYDVAQFPDDMRYTYQLMREFYIMQQAADSYRYCYVVMSRCMEKGISRLFLSRALGHVVISMFISGCFAGFEQFRRDHLDIDSYHCFDKVFLNYCFTEAAHANAAYATCIAYAKAYLAARKEYHSQPPKERLPRVDSIAEDRSDPKSLSHVLARLIAAADKLQNLAALEQTLDDPAFLECINTEMALRHRCLDVLIADQNWRGLGLLYRRLMKAGYDGCALYLLAFAICTPVAANRRVLLSTLSAEIRSTPPLAQLADFIEATDAADIKEKGQRLLDDIETYPLEIRVILRYAILKTCLAGGVAPEPFVEQFSVPDIDFICSQVEHPGETTYAVYTGLMAWQTTAVCAPGTPTHYLLMRMTDIVFKGMSGEGNRAAYLDQYNRYIDIHDDWNKALYRPELLDDTGSNLLSAEEQTVCALKYARTLEEQKDYRGVIRLLRAALYNSPKVKPAIGILLADLQETMAQEEKNALQQNPEFRALLATVKQKIEVMIAAGNGAATLPLINQLETLAPGDPDIYDLKKKAGLLH